MDGLLSLKSSHQMRSLKPRRAYLLLLYLCLTCTFASFPTAPVFSPSLRLAGGKVGEVFDGDDEMYSQTSPGKARARVVPCAD
eukprot:133030-Hanusia_phi.AAC.1